MDDITHALYQMDFSKIELESLWGLYEIRGKKEELEKINTHVQTHEDGEGNTLISGGSRGARDACSLPVQFFFIFMQFSKKNYGDLRPIWENSWIHHWYRYQFY